MQELTPIIPDLNLMSNYKWPKIGYEELGGYWSINLLSTNLYKDGSYQFAYVLYDCYAPITKQNSFIYQVLEKCTKIKFSNRSVLGTFIRKHRPGDCLISICPPDSSLNFMERIFLHMMWILWTPLVRDLRVHRMPKCCQAFHLDIALLFLKLSPPTFLGRILQKLTLRPLLLFCSYIRQLSRRPRDSASVITKFYKFCSYISNSINITQ